MSKLCAVGVPVLPYCILVNCVAICFQFILKIVIVLLADVLKGSNIKKIVDNGHNKTPHHGLLKEWEKADVQRLLRIMVTQEYLREDLIFANDIPQAYIYLGPKVEVIMKENMTIEFALTQKERKAQALNLTNDSPADSASKSSSKTSQQLKDIYERCYSDLLDLCRTIAAARNVTMASIMNIQAIKAMAEQLPETEADMCSIPHVTKANFDKYGEKLLEITRNYAAEKLCLLMDLEEMHEAEKVSNSIDNNDVENCNGDDEDWSRAAASQGSSNSGSYRGGKRKRNWRGGGAKKFKKSGGSSATSSWGEVSVSSSPKRKYTRKKSFGSPGRKKSTSARGGRGGSSTSRSSGSGGGGTWIAKKTGKVESLDIQFTEKLILFYILGSSGGFQLMPIPSSK